MARPKKVKPVLDPEVSPETEKFTIIIQIDQLTHIGVGKTALEALQAVPTPPLDFISTGTVTVINGEKKREMLYNTIQLKRLLNPYHQEVLANILTEGM